MFSFHLLKYAKIFFGVQDESIITVILLPIHFILTLNVWEKSTDLRSTHTISPLWLFLSSNWMRSCSSSRAERYRVSWAFWNSMIWSNTARNWFNRDCKHTQRTTELQKWGQVWGISAGTQLPRVMHRTLLFTSSRQREMMVSRKMSWAATMWSRSWASWTLFHSSSQEHSNT